MMKRVWRFIIACSIVSGSLLGEVRLPSVFGDNMVLQQKTKVPIWGRAEPGEKVSVTGSWQDKVFLVKTNSDGKWMVKLSTPEAGGPYSITISGHETIEIENVMIGEVWLCSGQSNMEMPLQGWRNQPILDSEEAIETAHFPHIRLFTVAGKWYYKIESDIKSLPPIPLRINPGKEDFPSVLFNAMIHPLVPYRIRGVIWYQGESNTYDPFLYRRSFPAMIQDWRRLWGQGNFPFYYVQIAPYDYDSRYDVAGLREAQLTTLALANTGMAVTMDIGTLNNIHPPNKEAGAIIDGKTVLVTSPEVPDPVAVRYGWSDIAQPNLFNKEGLPASPFRTDDWRSEGEK